MSFPDRKNTHKRGINILLNILGRKHNYSMKNYCAKFRDLIKPFKCETESDSSSFKWKSLCSNNNLMSCCLWQKGGSLYTLYWTVPTQTIIQLLTLSGSVHCIVTHSQLLKLTKKPHFAFSSILFGMGLKLYISPEMATQRAQPLPACTLSEREEEVPGKSWQHKTNRCGAGEVFPAYRCRDLLSLFLPVTKL